MAHIVYAANHDATNTTEDEMMQIAELDIDPTVGHKLSRDEELVRTEARFTELFDEGANRFVGVYLLPTLTDEGEKEKGKEKPEDGEVVPEGAVLVGQAVWLKVGKDTPSDQPAMDKLVQDKPVMISRFKAQITRTREAQMKGRDYWWLKVLTVHPEYQRRGLGSMLVKWGTQKADGDGLHGWLETSPMGLGAYLKAGFKVAGMDRIDEPRAKRGHLEWPYMIYDSRGTQ
uniref:N-acetyltransferase domain-containing protein n=2 Tax=Kalmanozyma brasiliensis (strain GHG001) TaxID=1365824 RepID=V5EPI7_KALBG